MEILTSYRDGNKVIQVIAPQQPDPKDTFSETMIQHIGGIKSHTNAHGYPVDTALERLGATDVI